MGWNLNGFHHISCTKYIFPFLSKMIALHQNVANCQNILFGFNLPFCLTPNSQSVFHAGVSLNIHSFIYSYWLRIQIATIILQQVSGGNKTHLCGVYCLRIQKATIILQQVSGGGGGGCNKTHVCGIYCLRIQKATIILQQVSGGGGGVTKHIYVVSTV